MYGTIKLKWHDFYPDDCPPDDAEPASGIVYRLVRHDPPEAEDFETLYEERPIFFENKQNDFICKGCGVSVCRDFEDIKRLQRSSGKMRKRKVAEGTVHSKHGMILHTPSALYKSHHTWWIPIGVTPWLVFNVFQI